MPSKRVMRGGNANVRPIEYYGGNSGRYFENPSPSSSEFAYGNYHPTNINGTGLFIERIASGFISNHSVHTKKNKPIKQYNIRSVTSCPSDICV